MFLIRTRLGPSRIHGLGVMADEDVASGQPIWRFAPGIDLVLPLATLEQQPAAFKAFVDVYAYESSEFPGCMVLSCDHAKFLNHSETPNTEIRGRETFAAGPIPAGREITCDYRLFVAGWTGFD